MIRMRGLYVALLALTAVATAPFAFANDSTASIGAGGLVLRESADVRMASEDLVISPSEIRVRYEFVNEGSADIDTIVAFPLPPLDLNEWGNVEVQFPKTDSSNFVGFEAFENGKPIAVTLEEKAFFGDEDVTDVLKGAGLEIDIFKVDFYDRLRALPQEKRTMLARMGLVAFGGQDYVAATWIVKNAFYWRQRFPKGETVVLEHRYRPVTGRSFYMEEEIDAAGVDYYGENYCIDAPLKAALRKTFPQRKASNPDWFGMLIANRTKYVLTTGANWKGPIGRFRLTLDKVKPENFLSLCWDGPLRKTGPTTFVSELTDFTPTGELSVLVLE